MKYAQSDARFFRAGVGTVIYNAQNEVALFRRTQHPIGVWQFQQGGIDVDEEIEATLWRELKEEIGLDQSAFDKVEEMPRWTIYTPQSALDNAAKSRLGQAHKWFFLKLKSEVSIDLSLATENEADDFRFDTFTGAIAECETQKKHVYEELQEYFLCEIL
jgi:putative (di)nucleoside polyphosphate hydrolase